MTASPPLTGITVVDASRVLAGPLAGQILADLGADVVKIEPPQGDETRYWGPASPRQPPCSAYFQGLNRSKRNIAIDLTTADGQEIFRDHLADADVLIENFKPDTLENWGFDRATIEARYPRLVHARISGFGRGGPLEGLPGYDAVIQAMTGLMAVNGDARSGPTRVGVPIVDLATGHYSVIGIIAALFARVISGRGQLVEISLYDVGLALNHPHAANWLIDGSAAELHGNSHPNIAPYDLFVSATGPIYLAVGNNRQFATLCRELGKAELADDPRFSSNSARLAHRAALLATLSALLAERDGPALCERLLLLGVPAGPVTGVPDALAHEHTAARNAVVRDGDYAGIASPLRFSDTPIRPAAAPRPFNADARR
jgi:crotonobetainyl-CoA:carnitine CoA-transferase CaiB-like acyl-CoA transferase